MAEKLNKAYSKTLKNKNAMIDSLNDRINQMNDEIKTLKNELARCSNHDNAKNAVIHSNIDINLNENFQLLRGKALAGIGPSPYRKIGISNVLEYPHNTKHQELIHISNETLINWHVEIEWRGVNCTNETHFHFNQHIGPIDENKNTDCIIKYIPVFASGTIISTKPYLVVMAAAHSFPNYGAKDYCIHWCPSGDQSFRIPMKYVKKHPKYNNDLVDASYDISIVVGELTNIHSSIQTDMNKYKMKPYQITIGAPFRNIDGHSNFYLKGFNQVLTHKPALFQSKMIKKIKETMQTVKFAGGVVFGQSGGVIIQSSKYRTNSIHCVGIQSTGVTSKNKKLPDDFHQLIMCRLSTDKIMFLKQFAPCNMILFDSNTSSASLSQDCITFYDK